MLIPAGVIIAWPGMQASIPSGWTRVTSLDGRYVKGTAAGVDPDVTGGASTHTHTSAAHSHTIVSHAHTGTTSGGPSSLGGGTGTAAMATNTHTHTASTSGATAPSSSTTAGTWGTASNEPAYYTVIWIASDGSPLGFPALSWAFWDKTGSLPTNWSNPAVARNVFPKGAPAAGDGGSTGGGAHTHTAAAHTHAFNSHTHTGAASGNNTPLGTQNAGAGSPYIQLHTHTVTFDAGATQASSQTSGQPGITTYEPPWAKLVIVQNDSGSTNIQEQHVAIWLGTLASIPAGWMLCDGSGSPTTVDMRDRFAKGANGIGEIGNTGGSAGHSHTDPSTHTHAYDHTHGQTFVANAGTAGGAGAPGSIALGNHSHAATSGAATGTSGATAQTAPTTADTQPPFRTVAFIRFSTGLEVTLDEPVEDAILGAPSPMITWSLAFNPAGSPPVQNDYRVRVFAEDQLEVVYDSGSIASGTQEHQLPSGILHNDLTYFIQVDATDTLGLSTVSALRQVTTSWVPPATITNLTAVQVGG